MGAHNQRSYESIEADATASRVVNEDGGAPFDYSKSNAASGDHRNTATVRTTSMWTTFSLM